MAALSTQPCTAWPAGSCRAPPEAAPRRQGPVPPQRPPALPQGWAPKKAAGSRTRTPTTARARSRQRGPSLPARRRGQWGAARQEPANTQTRPWKLAARPRYGEQTQPSWNAAPLSSFPFLPSPLPPAGRPYSRTPRRAPAHPATLSRPAIRSARGGHVTRGLLSEPMAGRAPLAPRARARAEGAPAAPRCCEGLGCFWGLGFVLLIKELCRIRFNHVSACSHRFCLNTVQPTKPGKKISSVKPQ